eukprot:TRINITY_DN4231_c0_g1_i1.p1 TRINITY_DN4231_c0_g1~~TRINITY_DN4231_c0_g1_i1.p1  ORF type:complete len:268 (+),score=65.51 TRINITY_DN4231_c0_g1_i1:61-864(+)
MCIRDRYRGGTRSSHTYTRMLGRNLALCLMRKFGQTTRPQHVQSTSFPSVNKFRHASEQPDPKTSSQATSSDRGFEEKIREGSEQDVKDEVQRGGGGGGGAFSQGGREGGSVEDSQRVTKGKEKIMKQDLKKDSPKTEDGKDFSETLDIRTDQVFEGTPGAQKLYDQNIRGPDVVQVPDAKSGDKAHIHKDTLRAAEKREVPDNQPMRQAKEKIKEVYEDSKSKVEEVASSIKDKVKSKLKSKDNQKQVVRPRNLMSYLFQFEEGFV